MGGPRPLLAIIAAAIRGSIPNVAGIDCWEEGTDISGDTLFEYDDLGGLPLPLLTVPPCPVEAEAACLLLMINDD